MSIETRLRETGPRGGGGGGGSSNSGGLAGTGGLYATYSNDLTLPFSKVLSAGNNITISTDSISVLISAITGGPGTGTVNAGSATYIAYYPSAGTTVDDATLKVTTGAGIAPLNWTTLTSDIVSPNAGDFWSLNSAGMFLKHFISGTAFYVRLSQTDGSVSSSSAGLAGTGVFYLGTSANSTWPNWFVLTPGSSVTTFTSGSNFVINAVTNTFSGSAGLAGTGPFYLLHTSGNGTLPLSKIISAGNNITITTDANAVFIAAATGSVSAWSYGTLAVGSGGTGSALFPKNSIVFSNGTNLVHNTFGVIYDIANSSLVLGTNSGISGQDYLVQRGTSVSMTLQTTVSSEYSSFVLNTPSNVWQVFAGGNASVDVGRMGFYHSGNVHNSLDIDSADVLRMISVVIRSINSNQLIIGGSGLPMVGLTGLSHGGLVVGSVGPIILNTGGQGLMLTTSAGTQTGLAWVGTSVSASSGGLASTGGLYVVTSASPLFPNSRILTAGSSTTVRTDGTAIYIDAITSGGSGTPGGSDGQVQVNSQNTFGAFANFRWINSSNSLDLNTAGRLRHGGAAEVDGVQPTGVTGLLWLDTSGATFSNTISFPLPVGSGGTNVTTFGTGLIWSSSGGTNSLAALGLGSALTILGLNSNAYTYEHKVLVAGSSISIAYGVTSVTLNSSTAGLAFQSTQINTTFPLAGGGDLSANRTLTASTAFLVTTNRLINTTSPAGGGGNLGGDLTLTVGSLSTIGSANQFTRTNTGGTAWDYINIVAGSSIIITQASGKLQIDASTGGATGAWSYGTLAIGSGGTGNASFGSGLVYNASNASAIFQTLSPGSATTLLGINSNSYTNEYKTLVGSAGIIITSVLTGLTFSLNSSVLTGIYPFLPQQAKLYASTSAARIDAGTAVWRLLYSATTQQFGIWQFILPNNYGSNPRIRILHSNDSSLSVAKSVSWIVDQWSYVQGNTGLTSIYVDTFGGTNTSSVALSAGYSAGVIGMITVPLATTVSFQALALTKIRISGSNGAAGNTELLAAELEWNQV